VLRILFVSFFGAVGYPRSVLPVGQSVLTEYLMAPALWYVSRSHTGAYFTGAVVVVPGACTWAAFRV